MFNVTSTLTIGVPMEKATTRTVLCKIEDASADMQVCGLFKRDMVRIWHTVEHRILEISSANSGQEVT